MKRLAVVLSALALAACAAEPGTPVASQAAPQPATAPGGEWEVNQDWPAEAVGVLASPYLGQPVTLDAQRAVDAAGRLCKTPSYWLTTATAAEALGNPAQPQAARDATPRAVLTVTCDGQPFATLVNQPDGSWLTRANSWVLRIGRPVPKPAPVVEMAPAPAPAPAPVAAPRHDPRTLVYLASYKTEAHAKAGFKTLGKSSPILAKQQPVTQAVDLGKKGKWVRLYGMAASEAERAAICKQLGKQVDECGARNRE
jgi:hypothetical protein